MNNIDLTIVPNKPGVYLWKNKFGNVIYVGKAKKLNSRMKQYFKGMLNSYKTAKLVEAIVDFDYVITLTEKEALILERNLIEKHAPEYNILLTDDKRYPYIMVTLKKILEIKMVYRVRSSRNKNVILYGPFPTGFGARRMLNLMNRLTTFEKGIAIKNAPFDVWEKKFNYAKKILSSGSKSLMKQLESKMFEAAKKQHYEVAHDIKESLLALQFYQTKQNVEINSTKNVDIIAFVEKDGYLSISMLFYRQGMLLSKNNKILQITSEKSESIRQFISQYYFINLKPDEIISNESIETSIKVIIPQKGTSKKIVKLALANALDNIELKLQEFIRREELTIGAMAKLEHILKIKHISHILMIDNSTTNNTLPISAIVSYRNGVKQKGEYKKYHLILNDRHADVEYMRQGISRYFSNETNPIPDLLIVDGGIAQVNEVKKIVPKINIIGLVKNNRHQTEAIINKQGKRMEIADKNLLNFLKNIQIEVDRFAKAFHRKKRKTTTLEGILLTINGIGPIIEKKLIFHFKTYAKIYNASQKELEQVVSKKIAINIKKRMTQHD